MLIPETQGTHADTVANIPYASGDTIMLSTILTLGGVVLGAAITFAGQYLGTRETRKQFAAARESAIRAERKEAIHNFLAICQRVEQSAEHRSLNNNHFGEGFPDLSHEMWYRQKALDLVGGDRVCHTAFELTLRLCDALYDDTHRTLEELHDFVHKKRQPFLEAAKLELGPPI